MAWDWDIDRMELDVEVAFWFDTSSPSFRNQISELECLLGKDIPHRRFNDCVRVPGRYAVAAVRACQQRRLAQRLYVLGGWPRADTGPLATELRAVLGPGSSVHVLDGYYG